MLSSRQASILEPWHDKTNKVTICPVWSIFASAWRKLVSLATHWAHGEDSDQTGRMPRLIWVLAGCTVISLVLSCCGSCVVYTHDWYHGTCFPTVIYWAKIRPFYQCQRLFFPHYFEQKKTCLKIKQYWCKHLGNKCHVVKDKRAAVFLTIELPHDKTNKTSFAPSEDSDQPGLPSSLIRVFALSMKKHWTLYLLNAQWRLADA